VGVNAFKRMLFLFLDCFLEGVDVLGAFNLDAKGIARAIALNQTVEFKDARHDYRKIEVMVELTQAASSDVMG
jgi:hypothetical protein